MARVPDPSGRGVQKITNCTLAFYPPFSSFIHQTQETSGRGRGRYRGGGRQESSKLVRSQPIFVTDWSTVEGEGGVGWAGGRVSFSQAGGPREMEDSISSAQSSTGAGGLLAVCRSSLGGRGPLSMARGGEEVREGPGGDKAPTSWST